MRRVVILGPGGAGKSALAVRLHSLTGLPVVELDRHFWRPGLVAMPREQWAAVQGQLVEGERWIMDGDLGPYDVLEVRLRAADTVILLDFSPLRCAWRAARRSRERLDFWRWLLTYRRRARPVVIAAIATHASNADVYRLPNPEAVKRFLAEVAQQGSS